MRAMRARRGYGCGVGRLLMQSPVLISILSGLCGCALLGFPALAGQEYGAWNLVLATGVVSHLTPGEPERLSCIGQAQSVTPAPADELDRIGSAVLFKGQFPERIRTEIEIAGPGDTVATFAKGDSRKERCPAQRFQPLEWRMSTRRSTV